MDLLPHTLQQNGAKMVTYANVLLMVVKEDSRIAMERKDREYLVEFTDWDNKMGVKINTKKTTWLIRSFEKDTEDRLVS